MDQLETIFHSLKKLRNEKTNTIEVVLETAAPLEETEKKYLTKKLQVKTGKNITLKVKINPALLGGVMIRIGDTLIDNSFKNKLDLLKQSLIR